MNEFINYETLLNKMKYLGLEGFLDNLDAISKKISNNEIGFLEAIDSLVSSQIKFKKDNVYRAAIKVSHFPFIKTMDDFEFDFQPSLNKAQILNFCTLEFLNKNENIIFFGTPGTGKTHLATAIGIEVSKNSKLTYFITCKDLIIDEIGHDILSEEESNDLFQLLQMRYERHSTLSLTNNTKTLNITLLGDLIVNGNLTVGAKTGNLTDSGELQSYIIGNYASIDLNGHDLIVNGTLRVFGEIKDSKNTGKIVVNNGGELYFLMSYTDGRGGNHTIWGYSKEQSSFTDYRFPYISSKILLNYGSRVRAYTKFNLGQLGGSAATFNLLGTETQNYYLTWCGDSNDYIEIIPYSVGNITNSNFLNRFYNYRYKIDIYEDLQFNNAYTTVQFSVSALIFNLKGSIDIYLSRVNFPISSFFDINILSDSKILLPYKIILYPGATLFVDENASLEFSYINNFTYERVSFEGIKHIPEVTKNLSGGIISYNYSFDKYSNPSISSIGVGLYSSTYSSYFTNYFNVNSANILGNIIFNSGNSEKYVFSAEINLSLNDLNIIKNNRDKVQTYYSLGQQNNDVWFSGISEATPGNDNAIVRVNSYLTLPLISNGSAYLISDSFSLSEGNYDNQNNIIEKDNEYYFVAGSDTVLEDNNSNQDNPIDTTVMIIKAEYINKEIQAVYGNGNFYVYYCGTYVKANENDLRLEGNSIIIVNDTVTINLGKFFSNSSKTSANYNEFGLRFSNKMWTKVSGI